MGFNRLDLIKDYSVIKFLLMKEIFVLLPRDILYQVVELSD